MSDLFKNVSWYIMQEIPTVLLHRLKYIPGVQETYDEVALHNPCMLRHVSDHFKSQEMCEKAVRLHSDSEQFRTRCGLLLYMPSKLFFNPDYLKMEGMCIEAVEKNPWGLDDVPDCLETQEMCNKAVAHSPYMLEQVPDHFKSQEMCEKTVGLDPWLLGDVPDWFVTQSEQLKIWHDDGAYYDDDELDKWFDGCQKCKAQKAQIEDELMPIAWNPSRWWDWCMSEDEKKETEKLWA